MSGTPAPEHKSFSLGRVLILAVPLALIVWGGMKMYGGTDQKAVETTGQRNVIVGMLGDASPDELAQGYSDADHDMVADAPKDAAQLKNPEEIRFSYVASSDSDEDAASWKELLAALEKGTGKKVTLVTYADTGEQLRALKDDELHVTAFSTGEAPSAVNGAGFVPAVCFADSKGDYHIKMKIIVPADSPIKKLEDLRPAGSGPDVKKPRITFVRPRSNSGCTAALVLLDEKLGMRPERDYTWGFSFGHENSIKGIADHKFDVAAVASDILDRMKAKGEVKEDAIREIYESEQSFPPGVIGYAYNLTPELQKSIRATLVNFDWTGTGLAARFGKSGSVKFAPVNYKDDWADVRKIRETGGGMLAELKP